MNGDRALDAFKLDFELSAILVSVIEVAQSETSYDRCSDVRVKLSWFHGSLRVGPSMSMRKIDKTVNFAPSFPRAGSLFP